MRRRIDERTIEEYGRYPSSNEIRQCGTEMGRGGRRTSYQQYDQSMVPEYMGIGHGEPVSRRELAFATVLTSGLVRDEPGFSARVRGVASGFSGPSRHGPLHSRAGATGPNGGQVEISGETGGRPSSLLNLLTPVALFDPWRSGVHAPPGRVRTGL